MAKKTTINPTADFAVGILTQYAHESANTIRSTSDLSPLEEWLIVKLYATHQWHPVEEKPHRPGTYYVRCKDGKIYSDRWNGSGWAYDGSSIKEWTELI